MEMIADLLIHDIVKNYSAYGIPIWQPYRIKHVVSLISEDLANKLDYTNANECAKSIAKELNVDITPFLVKNKYPVWVDLSKTETFIPNNKNVVITYIENLADDIKPIIDRIESYAHNISADFVVLTGRTQGYLQLEKFRVKAFAELYDRTLFISPNVYIKDNCPNLFDEVPEGYVGIYDDREIGSPGHKINSKMLLLKSETFTRTSIITSLHDYSIKDEAKLMDSDYDDSVVLCDKKDAAIWSPFTFPYRFLEDENRSWMEILIYRNGYNIFPLPKEFNHSIYDYNATDRTETKIERYEYVHHGENVFYTYLDDNNLIGYKDKDPVDMMPFKILSLYHDDNQLKTIQKRGYLEFFSLNDMGSRFGNSHSESRVFYEDFDYLFPEEFKYVGLTTASWNLKYVGLNPIDQLHNWAAIRKIDDNAMICSDLFPSERFTGCRKLKKKPVLRDVFPSITDEQIDEFITLVGLEKISRYVGVSSQIIAKRSIVKSLFDFYQSNEILDKIEFFYNKYLLETKRENVYKRRHGYFAETVTVLWMAAQDFITMPTETLKSDWYFKK